MTRKHAALCFAVFLLAFGLGCARQEDLQSPIVQAAQNAGAGDLANASTQAIEQWLGQHRPVSDAIEAMCKPVRQKAPADWGNTTEGRLCIAAHDLSFSRSAPVTGDSKAFRPGLH